MGREQGPPLHFPLILQRGLLRDLKPSKKQQCVSSKNILTLAFLLFLDRNEAVKATLFKQVQYYFHIGLKTGQ